MDRVLPLVAIDGPSGAGKSTVGKRLARRLSFRYIDTGAIYRAVALTARERAVSTDDEAGLAELLSGLDLDFFWRDGVNHVVLGGVDRTPEIRSEEMGLAASAVSRHPQVRSGLLALQRGLGRTGGVVMDGRDIGTVVFPDADVKFFLVANPAERARRRHQELLDRGDSVTLDQVAQDLAARDKADLERAVAPLRRAEDAILVDSTGRNIDEVVESMAEQVEKRMHDRAAAAGGSEPGASGPSGERV
jgi:cytidylate kinase